MKRPHPIDRMLERRQRDEKAYVEDPQRMHSIYKRDAVWGVIAFSALIADDWLPVPWEVASGAILGWCVGMTIMHRTRRASTYKFGWLAGRASFGIALAEASQRRMPLQEFVMAEMERDFAVLNGAGARRGNAETIDELERELKLGPYADKEDDE